jgi:hypothetical protein
MVVLTPGVQPRKLDPWTPLLEAYGRRKLELDDQVGASEPVGVADTKHHLDRNPDGERCRMQFGVNHPWPAPPPHIGMEW